MAAQTKIANSIDRLYDKWRAKTGDPVAAATLTLAMIQAANAVPGSATERDVLNPPDVATRLRVSPDTVLDWIRSGQLKASNVAGSHSKRPRYKIRRQDLDDFLDLRQPQRSRRWRREKRGGSRFTRYRD